MAPPPFFGVLDPVGVIYGGVIKGEGGGDGQTMCYVKGGSRYFKKNFFQVV